MKINKNSSLSIDCVVPKSKSILIRMIIAEGLVFLCEKDLKEHFDFETFIMKKFSLSNNLCDDVNRTIEIMQYLIDYKQKNIDKKKQNNNLEVSINCGESASLYCFIYPLVKELFPNIKLTGSEKLLERVNNANRNSSQPYSAKVIWAPLSKEGLRLKISSSMPSLGYFLLTMQVLKMYGINISEKQIDDNTIEYFIEGEQKYKTCEKEKALNFIEDDYTIIAYLDAYNYIFNLESKLNFPFKNNSFQFDKNYKNLFLKIPSETLSNISLKNNPDLAPILFCIASVLGTTEFVDLDRLRTKESDRIFCMQKELFKFGVKMDVIFDKDNTNKVEKVIVYKSNIHTPVLPIDSHNDHRIAMALSILLCKTGGEIQNENCVRKSFPDFYQCFVNK